MNTTVIVERLSGISPRAKARVAGIFEALEGVASASPQILILGKLVVAGNAVATAANILAHERLFWLGFASSVAGVVFHTIWIVLFYELFKPVNRTIALTSAFVGLIVCAMQALTAFFYLAPLLVLRGGGLVSTLPSEQSQGLAAVFLRLNSYAFDLDLVFFGLWCFLTGYLIFRSTFLPRILGLLLAIDGVGWMFFIVPPFASQVFPFIAAASGIAEIPLQLWLIIKGVNSQRWYEQAGQAAAA